MLNNIMNIIRVCILNVFKIAFSGLIFYSNKLLRRLICQIKGDEFCDLIGLINKYLLSCVFKIYDLSNQTLVFEWKLYMRMRHTLERVRDWLEEHNEVHP